MKLKNINDMDSLYECIRNFDSVENFLGSYIYEVSSRTKESDKILNNLINRYEMKNGKIEGMEKYFYMYSEYILLPKLINEHWESINKQQVDRAMILQSGRYFEDGFSGIQIKKMSYSDEYIVSIEDGERGLLFIKTYKFFPEKSMLIEDSVFNNLLRNDGKKYKKSIREIFNELNEAKLK